MQRQFLKSLLMMMNVLDLYESERHRDHTQAQIRHCKVGYEHVPEEEDADEEEVDGDDDDDDDDGDADDDDDDDAGADMIPHLAVRISFSQRIAVRTNRFPATPTGRTKMEEV